jgi:hypothetical protein
MVHHAIIVTGFDEQRVRQAHTKAEELFQWGSPVPPVNLVSPIIESVVNGFSSFFVAPDGSKSEWESEDGDAARETFIRWLEEGQTWCDWVEVQYGGRTQAC